MENKITFTVASLALIILAFFGLLLINGHSSNFFASSALAMVDTSILKYPGVLFVSFDNFDNVHSVILDNDTPLKIFDIDKGSGENNFWASTDRGLFLSRDGGLTWNRFTSSNNEISEISKVFSILPTSSSKKDFVVSSFKNDIGSVYLTNDEFFNLKRLIYFENEVPYSMFRSGNVLYLGMSNGQLIRYDIDKDHSRVVNVFTGPITNIDYVPNSGVYIRLSSGALLKSSSLLGEFSKVRIPSSGFLSIFRSGSVEDFDWDSYGNIYVLSNNRMFKSGDGGKSFSLYKTVPLTKEKINAMSVNDGVIRIVSENRMFTSFDGGLNWHIKDVSGISLVSHMYFTDGRVFLGK